MAKPRIGSGGLTSAYWQELIGRVSDTVKKIEERGTAATLGRTIPEDEHLLIGEGKQLRAAVMFLDISGFSTWDSGVFDDWTTESFADLSSEGLNNRSCSFRRER